MPSLAEASTWLNSSSDWFNSANWVGGVPDLGNGAILPASALPINPIIGANLAAAQSLNIDNSLGDYSISAPLVNGATLGTLSLGAGGFFQTGSGTSNLNVALRITAPTTFTVGDGAAAVLAGRFYGGSAINTFTKEGNGTFQLDQSAPTTDTANMTVNINAGVLEVRNAISLGSAPSVIVNTGAAFQIDPALSYSSGSATIGQMFFGNTNNRTTLKNGSTLRASAVGANQPVALFGKVLIDNGAVTTINAPANGVFQFAESFLNTAAAPGGTTSQINITGAAVYGLNGHSGASNSYTGAWTINHGFVGGLTGQTYLFEYDALGVSNTGYAAPVTLMSGFLTDVRSDVTHPVPNPIAFSGGVLNASATASGTTRTNAYFSGSINIQSVGGSTLDLSSSDIADLSGPVCNITLSGPISGSGLLFITAPTTNPQARGVVTFSNTSALTPNTINGNLVVQSNTALAATISAGVSNPLGSATITLAAGELRLNHPGSGSNGTITAFSSNSISLRGYVNGDIPASPQSNGTITLSNAAFANTGNTIVLNRLTFDAGGTASNQTLTIQNASAGVGYKARFDGTTTLTGTATITTGANPADVTLNGKITGSGHLIKAGNNTLTLSGASSDYTGSTTINAGTLAFNATHRINALAINNARAIITSGGNKFLKATTLSTIGTGALDLTDEDAILTTTSLTSVKTLITQGYSNGSWTGNGITSSNAATIAANAANPHKTLLGYATAAQVSKTTFNNEPVISTDVLIRYTIAGDANLDGTVDAADFTALSSRFGQASAFWADGDFNYDGKVNALDFNAIAANFGSAQATMPVGFGGSVGSVVPEPIGAMTLVVAGSVFVSRRRRPV